jgi:iron(III) transport system permease protein
MRGSAGSAAEPLERAAVDLRLGSVTWLALAVLLAVLVLYPLFWLALESVRAEDGSFTLGHYREAVTSPAFRTPIVNSFILATCVGVLSVVIAAPMAWAVARTDMPLRGLVRVLVFGSIITPGLLSALAWVVLAGPNAGLLNLLYRWLSQGTGGVNIFSMPGLIFVAVLECYPFAFLMIASALSLVSVDMEDAADILGSGTRRTLLNITLPLVLPAILAGFILSFLEALALFSSPATIGIPARVVLLTTEIWSLFQFPRRVGLAASVALPLLLVTMALLWMQARILGRRGYVTLTGKGGARRLIHLGWAGPPMLTFCLLVLSCSVILPYLVLFAYATARSWANPLGPANFTLDHFRAVLFSNSTAQRAIYNSSVLALGAATAASALGALLAYVIERRMLVGGRILRLLALAPMVIPGIVFAVGLFAGYTRPPLKLYGTLWILFLAYLTKFLPYAFLNAATAVKSVNPELEEAARIAGAGSFGAFRDVTAPLIRLGTLAGWFIVFIYSLRELSVSILLFTNQTTVIGVTILDFYEFGSWHVLSALGCLLLVVNLVVVTIGYRIIGLDFLGGAKE